ncbi:hypothetical protein BC938DRAFT_477725, partial [Jimgerdemannia flammicorona]
MLKARRKENIVVATSSREGSERVEVMDRTSRVGDGVGDDTAGSDKLNRATGAKPNDNPNNNRHIITIASIQGYARSPKPRTDARGGVSIGLSRHRNIVGSWGGVKGHGWEAARARGWCDQYVDVFNKE